MESPVWYWEAYVDFLNSADCSRQAMGTEVSEIISNSQPEVMCHGNVLPKTGLKWLALMMDSINCRDPPGPEETFKCNVLKLPKEGLAFQMRHPNDREKNSCTFVHYQVGYLGLDRIVDKVVLELIGTLAETSSFSSLRTKQQLGYTVLSNVHSTLRVEGLTVLIQSHTVAPIEMQQQIDTWFKDFRKELEHLTDEALRNTIQGLVSKKVDMPKNLFSETSQHWHEFITSGSIPNDTPCFNRNELEANALLQHVTKSTVIDFFDQHLLNS
eukprot:Platyproteum_vivax@DN15170_c0_g1_i1.p1